MKLNKLFFVVITMLGLSLNSCLKQEEPVGFDSSLPGPEEVTYDEMNSTSEIIAVLWNPDKAVNNGAISFTVQLVKGVDQEGDLYDSSISQVIQIDPEEGMYDLTQFSNLTEGKIFYVRARANYLGSRFSQWQFATYDGKPARIKVGKGIVPDDEMESTTMTKVRIGDISESTAIAEWSVSNFKNSDIDVSLTYDVELYKDKDCKDLEVSYCIGNIYGGYPGPRFVFSALQPATDYYLRVREKVQEGKEIPEWSSLVKFTTKPSYFKEIPSSPANEGDVILYQDFHELYWGGDFSRKAAGISSTKRSQNAELWKAEGPDPITNMADKGFYFVKASIEMGFYNTYFKTLQPNSSFKDWGWCAEDDKASALCARVGYAKLGAGSRAAWLVTPELSCLSNTATVEIKFLSQIYSEAAGADPGNVIVELFDNNNVVADNYNLVIPGSRVTIKQLSVDNDWKEYTIIAENVTPTSRIAIGGDRLDGSTGQQRFYLDDIQLKVLKYGSVAVDLTKPNAVTANEVDVKTANITWDAVDKAGSYVLEYKASGAMDWICVDAPKNSIKLENLDPDTEYEVRVKAIAGESSSEYSDVITFRTLVGGGSIAMKLLAADESALAINWSITNYSDALKDQKDVYVAEIYKDQACTDLLYKWTLKQDHNKATWGGKEVNTLWQWTSSSWTYLWDLHPNFRFAGLSPDTEYTIRIIDTNKDIRTQESYRTKASKFVPLNINAKPGEVILYQDFHELLWGGDAILGTAGFTSESRSSLTEITAPSGEDPTADVDKKFTLTWFSTKMGLFNTLKYSVPSTSLKDWGWEAESNKYSALEAGPGHLKLGAGNCACWLVSPELKCLPEGKSTIAIDFDLCPYREASFDPGEVIVEIFTDVTFTEKDPAGKFINRVSPNENGRFTAKEIVLEQKMEWSHHSVQVEVPNGCRVAIGGNRKNGRTKQERFYLDNIQIKYVN